jgi:hypothetical protein
MKRRAPVSPDGNKENSNMGNYRRKHVIDDDDDYLEEEK